MSDFKQFDSMKLALSARLRDEASHQPQEFSL